MFEKGFFSRFVGSITTLLLFLCFTVLAYGQGLAGPSVGSSSLPAGVSPQVQQLINSSPGVTVEQANNFLNQVPSHSQVEQPSQLGRVDSGEEKSSSQENLDLQTPTISTTKNSTTSAIEKLYQQQYNSSVAKNLQQYGYNIFNTSAKSLSKLAVPNDNYLLGPGDKLRIRIWGSEVDAQYVSTVNRDGTIDIPRVGIVSVTGTTFGNISEVLRKEAEKYVQGININVSLEELRTIEIYVVGEVAQPGLHLVPAFSTVLDGLTAGSVKKSGSLRSISLLRKNSKQYDIDLYTLLLKGSRASDLSLKDGDVLFVPRLKRTAAIAGGATQPAIYELLHEESAQDLLELAGGTLPQTFTGKMILRRFANNNEFVIQDLDFRSGKKDLGEIKVEDGDLLELQLVGTAWPQVITLEGNVWAKEFFAYHPGLKLSDILTGPQMLRPESIIESALLHHYNAQSTRYEIEQFPLAKLFEGKYDKELLPFDRVEILSRAEYKISEPIKVTGAVWRVSEYNFTPGLTLSDIIGMAGGFQFDADQKRIDLSRQIIQDGSVTTQHYSLSALDDGSFALQPYDYIYVRKIKDATSFKSVSIEGEVKYPGQYRINDGEKLSSLIERAGGYTEKAYFYGALFTSEKARAIQQKSIDQMVNELEMKVQSVVSDQVQLSSPPETIAAAQQALTGLVARLRQVEAPGRINITLAPLVSFKNSSFDFELSPGDRLSIPSSPNFVSVLGSVYSPNSFLYSPQNTLAEYVNRAGGPTKSADKDNIYILKANGDVFSSAQANWVFNSFGDTKLMPGDSIIVPENLERIPYLKLIGDISDIIFKIATTAGIAFAI